MKSGDLNRIVDIMEPATAMDDFNQPAGQDSVYLPKIPCSIEPLSTRELETARQLGGTATHKVTMYGKPGKPIKHTQYLNFMGRKLNISEAKDVHMNGTVWELIVGEVMA
jgi:head-tail adaptor